MNRRALAEWINSSSICDSVNLSWSSKNIRFAFKTIQFVIFSLWKFLLQATDIDRVGGWVWRHSQPRWLRRFALFRGPGVGWSVGEAQKHLIRLRPTLLTHSLAPICINWNPSFVAAILFSALHFAYLSLFDSERNRSESWGTRNNIVVSELWMKCKKVFAYRASHQLLPLKLIYIM